MLRPTMCSLGQDRTYKSEGLYITGARRHSQLQIRDAAMSARTCAFEVAESRDVTVTSADLHREPGGVIDDVVP